MNTTAPALAYVIISSLGDPSGIIRIRVPVLDTFTVYGVPLVTHYAVTPDNTIDRTTYVTTEPRTGFRLDPKTDSSRTLLDHKHAVQRFLHAKGKELFLSTIKKSLRYLESSPALPLQEAHE